MAPKARVRAGGRRGLAHGNESGDAKNRRPQHWRMIFSRFCGGRNTLLSLCGVEPGGDCCALCCSFRRDQVILEGCDVPLSDYRCTYVLHVRTGKSLIQIFFEPTSTSRIWWIFRQIWKFLLAQMIRVFAIKKMKGFLTRSHRYKKNIEIC